MIVRRESLADAESLRELFSGIYSDTLFDALHDDEDWLPDLSFVAVSEGDGVVGHVAATRATVDGTPVLALVPPSVGASHRGRRVVGRALMPAVIGLVAMPPEWFTQFGFQPSEEHSIVPSVGGWKPDFLIRPLIGYIDALRGTFRFPTALEA